MKKNTTAIDSIAAKLRQTEATITDDGFTAAVMVQLPRTGELPVWQKNTILLAATALGSTIVAWQAPVTIVAEFLQASIGAWPMLLGTAVMLTYSAAAAAVWTARRY